LRARKPANEDRQLWLVQQQTNKHRQSHRCTTAAHSGAFVLGRTISLATERNTFIAKHHGVGNVSFTTDWSQNRETCSIHLAFIAAPSA
jgi:hypothetical protein